MKLVQNEGDSLLNKEELAKLSAQLAQLSKQLEDSDWQTVLKDKLDKSEFEQFVADVLESAADSPQSALLGTVVANWREGADCLYMALEELLASELIVHVHFNFNEND